MRRRRPKRDDRGGRARRAVIGAGAGMSCALLAGCVAVPPLNADGISIAEIVQRVKCEIAFAVPEPRGSWPDGPYQWMSGWSAKVDLTLKTDAQAALTPTAVFTRYFPYANTVEAGPLLRFVTFGVGGGVGTTANRTEILSFTLSLRELREFKRRDECNLPWGIDVYGNLGLQEWVASALTPVESRQLTVGIHPPPGGRSLPAPQVPKERVEVALDAEVDSELVKRIRELTDLRNEALRHAKQTVASAAAAMRHAQAQNIAAFYRVASRVNTSAGKADDAVDKARHKALEAEELAIGQGRHREEIDVLRRSAVLAGDDAAAAKKAVDAVRETLPHDPPVDSLSHSVQFVVAVTGSVTPNWTLVNFRGPGAAGPLASASHTVTHTLNISMGSPAVAAAPTAGVEQTRQLNNLVIIQNLGQQPRPLP